MGIGDTEIKWSERAVWHSLGRPDHWLYDSKIVLTDKGETMFRPLYDSFEAYCAAVEEKIGGTWDPSVGIAALDTSALDYLAYKAKILRKPTDYCVSAKYGDTLPKAAEHDKIGYDAKMLLFAFLHDLDDAKDYSCEKVLKTACNKVKEKIAATNFYSDGIADEFGLKGDDREEKVDVLLFVRKLVSEIEAAQERAARRKELFAEFWKKKKEAFYDKYIVSKNVKYPGTDKSWFRPIKWDKILSRVAVIESAIGKKNVDYEKIFSSYISLGDYTALKKYASFRVDLEGDRLVYPNYTLPKFLFKSAGKAKCNFDLKTGHFDVSNKSEKTGFADVGRSVGAKQALRFFCEYVRYIQKNASSLSEGKEVKTAWDLYNLDAADLGKDYRKDPKLSGLLQDFADNASCIEEMPDEALLFDMSRVLLGLLLDTLAEEEIAKLNKKESALRKAPVTFSFFFFAGLLAVYGIYRYTLIDQLIGQLALTALVTLLVVTYITICGVVSRNKAYDRPYGKKRDKKSDYGKKCGKGRRWACSLGIITFLLLVTGCYFMGRYDAYDESYYYNRRADHTMVVAGLFDRSLTEVSLPKTYEDYEIIGVAANSFLLPNQIQRFFGGANCKTVGANAFRNCDALETVDLSSSEVTLGAHAFENCDALTTVKLHSATTEIPAYCFKGCLVLEELTGGKNVSIVGDGAFKDCACLDAAQKVSFAREVGDKAFYGTASSKAYLDRYVSIGDYAFANCAFIRELRCASLAPSLEIGKGAFSSCESLERVDLVFSDSTLPKKLFENCESLSDMKLRGTVTRIEKGILYGCGALDAITLPFIGDEIGAFKDMGYFISAEGKKTLRKITILDSAEMVVVKDGFKDCESLVSLSCNTITKVEEAGFKNCSNFRDISFAGITTIGKEAFANTALESYASGSVVTEIGDKAFAGCQYLKSASIMDPSLTLGKQVFADCPMLASFRCAAIGSDKSPRTLKSVLGSSVSSVETVYVTDQASLATSAFEGCGSLYKVVLGERIEEIPKYCFKDCAALAIVDAVNLLRIGTGAFYGCENLRSVPSMDTLVEVGAEAFSYTGVTAFIGTAALEKVGDRAFAASDLSTLDTSESFDAKLGRKAFTDCKQLSSVSLAYLGSQKSHATMEDIFGSTKDIITAVGLSGKCEKEGCFEGCESLCSVYLAEDQTVIPARAFKGCTALTSVEAPAVTVVKEEAFRGCEWLSSVSFDAVERIEKNAYRDTAIRRLSDLPSLAYIGEGAFANSELTSVSLTHEELSCGEGAFDRCDDLTSVSLSRLYTKGKPSTMETVFGESRANVLSISIFSQTELAKGAFNGCYYLTDLVLESPVETIPDEAFGECFFLSRLTLNGVTSIGKKAFFRCYSLDKVPCEAMVTLIKADAFRESGILSYKASADLHDIGKNAFRDAEDLLSVDLTAATDLSIGKKAFAECDNLYDVSIYELDRTMKKVFGESRRYIGRLEIIRPIKKAGCFSGCSSLVSMTLSDEQTTIPAKAFSGCTSLCSVVGRNVTVVKKDAFRDCTYFSDFECGELTEIGNYAFYDTSIDYFTGTEALKVIGKSAFEKSRLLSVTIDGSDTKIKEYAFANCPDLVSLVVNRIGKEKSPKPLSYLLGTKGVSWIQSVTVTNQSSIAESAYRKARNLLTVKYLQPVEKVPSNAFRACDSLTTFDLSNASSIGTCAFYQCGNLRMVTFSNSLRSISRSAFSGCYSLTAVAIPNSVEKIGERAFYECSGLLRVTFGSNVKVIYRKAFAYCLNLNCVIFNQGLETIESSAFRNCDSLSAIALPSSVKKLGTFAFYDCSYRTDMQIYYGGTHEAWNEIRKSMAFVSTYYSVMANSYSNLEDNRDLTNYDRYSNYSNYYYN
ncbi:MAG: leucine-rich repeat protein [Clostridia bacterium]|nr:leucine-rich repeat protein [Clostridia bacterium]